MAKNAEEIQNYCKRPKEPPRFLGNSKTLQDPRKDLKESSIIPKNLKRKKSIYIESQ